LPQLNTQHFFSVFDQFYKNTPALREPQREKRVKRAFGEGKFCGPRELL
jgi:hypothetical protein